MNSSTYDLTVQVSQSERNFRAPVVGAVGSGLTGWDLDQTVEAATTKAASLTLPFVATCQDFCVFSREGARVQHPASLMWEGSGETSRF